MKRELLALLSAWVLVCGCAGRMDTDLLQARIREQATQLTESQREIAKTRTELKRTRVEADLLKTKLAQAGHLDEEAVESVVPVAKLRFHSLSSGGLNKDDQPGDDVVVVQFVPLDSDQAAIQVPGDLEFTIIDPLLPEADRELGRWNFSSDECRKHWTRGIASSGYQFSLPLDVAPRHTDLVVHLKFETPDDRQLDMNHLVKVVLPADSGSVQSKRKRLKPVRHVDEADEFLPPVGEPQVNQDDADGADDESERQTNRPGRAVLHSSNWTEATIPQLR